jgi:hypothetical protein
LVWFGCGGGGIEVRHNNGVLMVMHRIWVFRPLEHDLRKNQR